MSDERLLPEQEAPAALQPATEQEEQAQEQAPQTELESLIGIRDRSTAFADYDRILAAGTPVVIAGVECRLISSVPVRAPEFRDEAVFAEHLSQVGGLAANASGLRNRYNGNGALVGVNEEHGLNQLDARIAELEKEAEARAQAAAPES